MPEDFQGDGGMASAKIDFSAQFGGRDAAEAVLPHFRALKAAARELQIQSFPFAELAFLLRVGGEVSRFGSSGAGNVEIDRDGEYLSVDIVIDRDDHHRSQAVITAALLSSVELIKAMQGPAHWDVDLEALQACLMDLSVRYEQAEAGTWKADTR
jgi:hypothetical protein